MQILLQQTASERFFAAGTRWTSSNKEAIDFGSVARAIGYAGHRRLKNVKIIVKTDSGSTAISLDELPLFSKKSSRRC